MIENQCLDKWHQTHRHTTINRSHDRHWPTTPKVKSRLHDYGQKERQNQITFNTKLIDHAGPSFPPLIHPSTESSPAPPINTTPEKDHLPCFEEIKQPSIQKYERRNLVSKADQETDKMALKQTRVAAAKTNELQFAETPLMRRLRNIKNTKV